MFHLLGQKDGHSFISFLVYLLVVSLLDFTPPLALLSIFS